MEKLRYEQRFTINIVWPATGFLLLQMSSSLPPECVCLEGVLKGRGGTTCTYIRKMMLLCSVLLQIRLRYLDCVHLLDPRPYLILYYAGFTFF